MSVSDLSTRSFRTKRSSVESRPLAEDSVEEADDRVYWSNAMVGVGALALFAVILCVAAWRAPERDVALYQPSAPLTAPQSEQTAPPPYVLL